MKIGLINDRPEHPMLTELVSVLQPRHSVVVLNEAQGSAAELAAAEAAAPAGLYLCKSHDDHALELAGLLEAFGARVINGSSATRNAQDRVHMAAVLAQAGIPSPATTLAERLSEVGTVAEPLVIKSRISRRGDLVAHVNDHAGLNALLGQWGEESVVTQPWVPNDGWDLKLWVVGERVFGAHRPTPLELGEQFPDASAGTVRLGTAELPARIHDITAAVGAAFDLEIFGVDVIIGVDETVVVDVNPFPGARGIPGFAEAIADLVDERLVAERVA